MSEGADYSDGETALARKIDAAFRKAYPRAFIQPDFDDAIGFDGKIIIDGNFDLRAIARLLLREGLAV